MLITLLGVSSKIPFVALTRIRIFGMVIGQLSHSPGRFSALIRDARDYDMGSVFRGLKQLVQGIVGGYMCGSMSAVNAESGEEIFGALRQLLGAHQFPKILVADDGGGVIGFVVGYASSDLGSRAGIIHLLWVKPQNRRRGVGRELVDAILEHFSSCQCHYVVAQTQGVNVAARALFASYGMTEEEITYAKPLGRPEQTSETV